MRQALALSTAARDPMTFMPWVVKPKARPASELIRDFPMLFKPADTK